MALPRIRAFTTHNVCICMHLPYPVVKRFDDYNWVKAVDTETLLTIVHVDGDMITLEDALIVIENILLEGG